MPSEKTVLYEVDNAIATITLNRPQVLNAFDATLLQELNVAIAEARADNQVRAVILTGAGKGFSAGADISAGNLQSRTRTVEQALNEDYKPALINLSQMPKPVISAVNGAAAGIGAAFALICDLTVMSEKSFILMAFGKIGLIPDGGLTWILTQQLGYKRAYQLSIEGERFSAQRCLEVGLANQVVPSEALLPTARAWAEKLSQFAPLSMAYTKQAMRLAPTLSFEQAISYEANLQNICVQSEDSAEGVRAFFEKRQPNFTGK